MIVRFDSALRSGILGAGMAVLHVVGCAGPRAAGPDSPVQAASSASQLVDPDLEQLIATARRADASGSPDATPAWARAGAALEARRVEVRLERAVQSVDEWLAWSADGGSIAALSGERVVVLDAARLDVRFAARGAGATFAGAGKLLVRSDDRRLRLWEIASGKLLRTIEEPSDYVLGEARTKSGSRQGFGDWGRGRVLAAVSADAAGRFAITAEGSNAIVWNLSDGSQRAVHELPSVVLAVAISQDGRWCAAGGGKDVQIFDTASGRRAHRVELPEYPRMLSVAPDGSKLAVLSIDDVQLIDVASGTARQLRARPSENAIAFAGSQTLVVPTAAGITLWDSARDVAASTLPQKARSLLAHPSKPIVIGSGGGTEFRLEQGRFETVRAADWVTAVWLGKAELGFGTTQGRSAIVGSDGQVSFGRALAKEVQVIAGSPGGSRWAIAGEEGALAVVTPGGNTRELLRMKTPITALAFADETTLWVGSHGALLSVNVDTGVVGSRAAHEVIEGGLARNARHAIVLTRAFEPPLGGGEIALLEVATGRVLARSSYSAGYPRASVGPTGDAVLFAGETTPTWWPRQGEPRPLWPHEPSGRDSWWDVLWLSRAGVGVAGRHLLAVSDPGSERVSADVAGVPEGSIWRASGDDDGKRVALASEDGVAIVDLVGKRRIVQVFTGAAGAVVLDERGRVQLSHPAARALLQCRMGARWFPYALCAANRESSSVWRDAVSGAR